VPVVPIRFQDLEFDHAFAKCRTAFGEPVVRWVPYGMPRFRADLERSSFYLYRRNPKTNAVEGPCGSGILIEWPSEQNLFPPHLYAVTAYHVAVADGASIMRINTMPDGDPAKFSSRTIELEPEDWKFIPGGDDVAAVDITDKFIPGHDWVRAATDIDFVTYDFIHQKKVGLGEDGFMLGLFTSHPGTEYNLPATRFGNIARIADTKHPIVQGHKIAHPSHVFDIHSRPGYSGSPVFIYRTPANALTGIDKKGNWNLDTTNNLFLALLGIHSGQFNERVKVKKAPKKSSTKAEGQEGSEIIGVSELDGDTIQEGDNLLIQSSMTIVVPAWAIESLLNLPEFKEQRTMRDRKIADDDSAPKVEPESAAAESSPPSNDANPNHREDFTRLVSEAVRKREPKD
jgi:hypothetical protein